jgi:hypothetical protein
MKYFNSNTLSFAAIFTHPDIIFAVGYLACFNSNPGLSHWVVVKHLFHYLKGTLDYKLVYKPDLLQQYLCAIVMPIMLLTRTMESQLVDILLK